MQLIFLVVALVCFVVSAWPGAGNWNRLISVGLAALVASMISWGR